MPGYGSRVRPAWDEYEWNGFCKQQPQTEKYMDCWRSTSITRSATKLSRARWAGRSWSMADDWSEEVGRDAGEESSSW